MAPVTLLSEEEKSAFALKMDLWSVLQSKAIMVNDLGEKYGERDLEKNWCISFLIQVGLVVSEIPLTVEMKERKRRRETAFREPPFKTVDQKYPKALQFPCFLRIPFLTLQGSSGY